MSEKDPRLAETALLLFNVANAIILGFAIGRWFTFPFPSPGVGFMLVSASWGLILGFAFAIYLVWRKRA
jgi:hypothetical protein